MRVGEPCPICLQPGGPKVDAKQATCSPECGLVWKARRTQERRDRRYRDGLAALNVDSQAQVYIHEPVAERDARNVGISPEVPTVCHERVSVAERTRPVPWREEPETHKGVVHSAPVAQRPALDADDTGILSLPKRTSIREAEPEPRATTNLFPERGVMVDTDPHYPIACPYFEAAKIAFARDVKPTMWINLGDYLDTWFLSRYTKESSRLFGGYGVRLQEEIDSGRPYAETMCGIVDEAHMLLGNHEHRHSKMISENPGLHGLQSLGWKRMLAYPDKLTVHPYGTRLRIGGAPLDGIHGDTIPMGVKAKAAWLLANKGNRTTLFGHSHHVEQATRTFYDEAGEPITHGAYQIGHGSIVSEQTYVTEPNWQHSFAFIEFWRNAEGKVRFSVHPILFIEGAFRWHGRVYDGRKWQ